MHEKVIQSSRVGCAHQEIDKTTIKHNASFDNLRTECNFAGCRVG